MKVKLKRYVGESFGAPDGLTNGKIYQVMDNDLGGYDVIDNSHFVVSYSKVNPHPEKGKCIGGNWEDPGIHPFEYFWGRFVFIIDKSGKNWFGQVEDFEDACCSTDNQWWLTLHIKDNYYIEICESAIIDMAEYLGQYNESMKANSYENKQ